ncbi:hypothetical protein ACFL5O_07250 [Myxococcota bacterium]
MTTALESVLVLLVCWVVACGETTTEPRRQADAGRAGAAQSEARAGGGTQHSTTSDVVTEGRDTQRGLAGASSEGGSEAMDPERAEPSCTEEVASCPASRAGEWHVLLDAKDFGDSARFVALGGRAVIVDTGVLGFQVVSVLHQDDQNDPASSQSYTAWKVPSGARHPVAVVEGVLEDDDVGRPSIIVLVCSEARTECSLLRGDLRQDQLSPWSGTELPPGLVPRGLVFDSSSPGPAVCVYGNGLSCFRSEWQTGIPVVADLQLNHVAISSFWSLAVGEEGRWYKRERNVRRTGDDDRPGGWKEQPPLGAVSLTYASTADLGGVIIGDGRILAALGVQSEFYSCALPRELAALMLFEQGGGGLAYAVTRSGEVIHRAPVTFQGPYCTLQQLPNGEITAIGTAPCMDAMNPRLLLDGALLLGQNVCLSLGE